MMKVRGVGVCSLEGPSHGNEDRFVHFSGTEAWILTDTGQSVTTSSSSSSLPAPSFFAVYDGHAGDQAVTHVAKTLHAHIFSPLNRALFFPAAGDDTSLDDKAIEEAILKGFRETEAEVLTLGEQKDDISGACAVTVVHLGDRLYVANLGDSRALIGRKKVKGSLISRITLSKTSRVEEIESREKEKRVSLRVQHRSSFLKTLTRDKIRCTPVALTRDLKAVASYERQRIIAAGGWIRRGRVFGVLAPSRSFGDPLEKGRMRGRKMWRGTVKGGEGRKVEEEARKAAEEEAEKNEGVEEAAEKNEGVEGGGGGGATGSTPPDSDGEEKEETAAGEGEEEKEKEDKGQAKKKESGSGSEEDKDEDGEENDDDDDGGSGEDSGEVDSPPVLTRRRANDGTPLPQSLLKENGKPEKASSDDQKDNDDTPAKTNAAADTQSSGSLGEEAKSPPSSPPTENRETKENGAATEVVTAEKKNDQKKENKKQKKKKKKNKNSEMRRLKGVKEGVVIAVPEMTAHTLVPEDDFLVLATDGLWDVMDNKEVVDHVSPEVLKWRRLKEDEDREPGKTEGEVNELRQTAADFLDSMCKGLCKRAKRRGSRDDITVVIVIFEPLE